MGKIKLLVLSDLHVVSKSSEHPRHYAAVDTDGQSGKNALSDLVSLIKSQKITADYILCCGDISNQNDPLALSYAWGKLHQIRAAARAKKVLTTAGNHDIDSRKKTTEFDPQKAIKELSPLVPHGHKSAFQAYWSEHFAIHEHSDFIFVSLNTCAYHGAGEAEFQRGRIASSTIGSLTSNCTSGKHANKAKIVLLHHHPVPFHVPTKSELQADNEGVIGGELLIKEAGKNVGSEWLFIHGHRHFPNIMYSYGGNSSPTIFSCGSFASRLYDDISSIATNQFYILTLNSPVKSHVHGRYEAWSYSLLSGWSLYGRRGIPSVGGFGFRGDMYDVAMACRRMLGRKKHVSWSTIVKEHPQFNYIIPDDIDLLSHLLRREFSVSIVLDNNHSPFAIEAANG